MDSFFQLPLSARMGLVAVVGLFVGKVVNWAIYRCSYSRWDIGPWCAPPTGLKRSLGHWLPVYGWIAMRHEAGKDDHHSSGFWVRPLLIELFLAGFLAFLYKLEVTGQLLLTTDAANLIRIQPELHIHFAFHALLICFLVAASFIDFDERMIPDAVTIPGTLIALVLSTFVLAVQIPDIPRGLHMSSPNPLLDWHNAKGLGMALLCFGGWCWGVIPKVATMRFGLWRGLLLMIASVIRPKRKPQGLASPHRPFRPLHRAMVWMFVLQWIGWAWILAAWTWLPKHRWEVLLSQLFGLAIGGAMIWSIRIIGYIALRREAMGFGDVILMSMIGAYVGWQPCLLIFGLAPASAVIVALLQYLFTRETEIAFGPYLALGTVLCLVFWKNVWHGYARPYFELGDGWFVPLVGVVCLLLMGGMLSVIRIIKSLAGVAEDEGNGALA